MGRLGQQIQKEFKELGFEDIESARQKCASLPESKYKTALNKLLKLQKRYVALKGDASYEVDGKLNKELYKANREKTKFRSKVKFYAPIVAGGSIILFPKVIGLGIVIPFAPGLFPAIVLSILVLAGIGAMVAGCVVIAKYIKQYKNISNKEKAAFAKHPDIKKEEVQKLVMEKRKMRMRAREEIRVSFSSAAFKCRAAKERQQSGASMVLQ